MRGMSRSCVFTVGAEALAAQHRAEVLDDRLRSLDDLEHDVGALPERGVHGGRGPQLARRQQRVDRDLPLHPRQWRAEAVVDARSKRDVRIGTSGQIEAIRISQILFMDYWYCM